MCAIQVCQRNLPAICEPQSVYETETDPLVLWRAQAVTKPAAYSIRVPPRAGRVTCPGCGLSFFAAGPTGYAEEQPVCDLCLLLSCQELGMVMALVAVVRMFGSFEPLTAEEYSLALTELGGFARIYERFAAKAGPARVIRIPRFDP